ncbi:phage antirepressor KilAC domain-containing protein [Dysgonomonas sp. GY75]|uniref:phage antirepressor KilAC domain-containing protein n=1 Tax=Dysgonomonas sp. GY75 TaxID=2780419 RepID=UPI0018838899|nr:phage antirepressor KilAC domain-containing protein [Dysgonomonas sp. GY75]MBF0648682.1 phage antirepressor KilAC domain-containing protein [Dysgonomonas sp. GY75]
MKPVNETIPFRDTSLHIIPDEDGAVTRVSLHDLCRILKRKELIDNREAIKLCPSSQRFPVYTNGKLFWFISISDIYVLLRHVRKENRMIAKVCDELEKWVGTLPVGRNNPGVKLPLDKKIKESPDKKISKSTDAQTVDYEEMTDDGRPENADGADRTDCLNFDRSTPFFEYRGKIYRNATEMAGKYGKNPREWLLLAETQRFRQSLVDEKKSESLESQIITKRGGQGVTFLENILALEFARWLDPKFAIKGNEVMDRLGTYKFVVAGDDPGDKNKEVNPQNNGKDEVMPASASRYPVPKTFSEALLLAAKLQQQMEEDKPKVEFYNNLVERRDTFKSTFIAMELDISVIHLHKFLVDERICKFEKNQYIVYPSHNALQCDHPYYWTNKNGKTYAYSKARRWTRAGREFIIELYREKHPQNIMIIE